MNNGAGDCFSGATPYPSQRETSHVVNVSLKKFAPILTLFLGLGCQTHIVAPPKLAPLALAGDGRGFVQVPAGKPFHPWGHNYGHDGRLIEDLWETNWPAVAGDFRDMQRMGANVVRVHLQFGKFMLGPDQPNPRALALLARLTRLAEATRLYLDLTGLACYRRTDVPAWYDRLSESNRWAAQANFWRAIARTCARSPAIFCYDLINEPIAAGGSRHAGDYYTGEFGGYDFIQFINLEQGARTREQIAHAWVDEMRRAIRGEDKTHFITVGIIPPPTGWATFSAFEPKDLAPELDFICVHIYPEKGKENEAMATLRRFVSGKPLVIEETFPLYCGPEQLKIFLLDSRAYACGWIGHYNGETLETLDALERAGQLKANQRTWREWLQVFQELRPAMVGGK